MSLTERFIPLWMNYVVSHPIRVITGSLLISALFLAGLVNFQLNPSPRDFLGKDMPLVAHLIELEDEYVEDLNIFVMLNPSSTSVFHVDVLSAVQTLTEAAWSLPFLRRVDSLTNFQYTLVDGDELLVEDLVSDPTSLAQEDLERLRDIALNEPRLVDLLVARDGQATGINMLFSIDPGIPKDIKRLADALDVIKQGIEQEYPDIEIYESGYVSMADHWHRGAILDFTRLFTLSLLVIFLGLLYFFRNLRATLAVLV